MEGISVTEPGEMGEVGGGWRGGRKSRRLRAAGAGLGKRPPPLGGEGSHRCWDGDLQSAPDALSVRILIARGR